MRDMLTFLISFQQPFLTICAWKYEIKNPTEIKIVKFVAIYTNRILIFFFEFSEKYWKINDETPEKADNKYSNEHYAKFIRYIYAYF